MTTLLRKLKNAPFRVRSFTREITHAWSGLLKAARVYVHVARRKRNTVITKSDENCVVVINSIRTFSMTDVEYYLAYLLACQGATVYLVFDDGILRHWDSAQANSSKALTPYHSSWSVRFVSSARIWLLRLAYGNGRIKTLRYSEILNGSKWEESPDQSDVGHAISSTKRFYQTGVLDLDGEHRGYYEKSLSNCNISNAVADYIVRRLKPDLFITSHGIYSLWGPAYCRMKREEIPVVVCKIPGAVKGKIRLTSEHDLRIADSEEWAAYYDRNRLSSKSLQRGGEILENRLGLQSYDLQEYFPSGCQDTPEIAEKDDGVITYGLFPNVVWDGDVDGRSNLFSNVIDWCVCSINAIRKTRHHLYVRFHPAEATRLKGAVLLEEILRRMIPDLDEIANVTLIGSDQKLNSYEFCKKHVDVGLIYDGTLCLEITYLGIPVIACARGMYALDSIVWVPSSVAEYEKLLGDPEGLISSFAIESEERQASACLYAEWMFEGSLMSFEPLIKPFPAVVDYACVPKGDKLSSEEDKIAQYLIGKLAASK